MKRIIMVLTVAAMIVASAVPAMAQTIIEDGSGNGAFIDPENGSLLGFTSNGHPSGGIFRGSVFGITSCETGCTGAEIEPDGELLVVLGGEEVFEARP